MMNAKETLAHYKTVELLPCPFCGGSAILQEHPAHTHAIAQFMPDHVGSATVECGGCNVGMINDTVAQVTTDWNMRSAPVLSVDDIAKVEKAAKMLAHMGGTGFAEDIRTLLARVKS
jgi:hypothetical protein